MNLICENGDTLTTEASEILVSNYQSVPLYKLNCRSFGNHTAKICSSLDPDDDLTKGDGVTAATYPTFVATDTDTGTPSHYVFDGVNDYVGNWPTMPTEYTVVAVVDDGRGPELWTCNDDTIKNALDVSGAWTGSLYRLAIFDEVLDAEQIAFLKYRWLSMVPRGGCRGIENRLILEESCIAAYRFVDGDADDRTDNGHDGTETDVTYSDDGAEFALDTSAITVPYGADLQLSAEISVAFVARLENRKIIARGINYEINITTTPARFYFKASGASSVVLMYSGITLDSELHHYAMTCVSGEKFLLWMDGTYIGEGTSASTLGTATDDLIIGSMQSTGQSGTIKTLQIFNRVLTEAEIKSLYHRSKIG